MANIRVSSSKVAQDKELVTGLSAISTDSAQPIKSGIAGFNSDGTPRVSRVSSYSAPGSALIQRNPDSPRAFLLPPIQPMSVEASGSSLLSPGSSKKVTLQGDLLSQ